MRTSTKRYGSSSKYQNILDRAIKIAPELEWVVTIPDPETTKNFGDGFVIQGQKGGKFSVFFILWEDPRKDEYIMMITNNVMKELEDATE